MSSLCEFILKVGRGIKKRDETKSSPKFNKRIFLEKHTGRIHGSAEDSEDRPTNFVSMYCSKFSFWELSTKDRALFLPPPFCQMLMV